MLEDEKRIIEMAVRGDTEAFGALYNHYQPQIYRFTLIKIGRREEAEDLTHDAFLSAWQNIEAYRYSGFPFSSWLYKIIRNKIIDFYRSRKATQSIEDVTPEYFAVPAATHHDIEKKLEGERLMRAIRTLKPDHQDVLVMRYVEDMPIREVARAMERSIGAIKLLQYRAIRELKKAFEANLPYNLT